MAWTRFLRRAYWDAERAKELDEYLAQETADNLARGMSADAARQAAHRKLGNLTRIREDIYDMNTLWLLDTLWQDVRYGLRTLRTNPMFSLVAVLTLALGTGANAAIFQLVNAVRLRPLPVDSAHELVSVGIETHGKPRVGQRYRGRSVHAEPIWQELRSRQQAFSTLIAWGSDTWDLSDEGEVLPAQGLFVSGGFFDGLGVRPHAGRVFSEGDDREGCGASGAVLSHAFWQARYGGDRRIIGQTLTLDRRRFDVIGVAAPGFFGVEVGRTFDVAVPLCTEPLFRGEGSGTGRPDVAWLDVMGRLKPEWTLPAAAAHLAGISPVVFKATVPPSYTVEDARNYSAFTLTLSPAATGVSDLRRQYATELWVLLAATGLVLLITCANLANLMIARATARHREIAVRLAIGASRRRVVRQMLAESLPIAALGTVGGLILALWISHALVALLSTEGSRIFLDLTPDWRVLVFMAAVGGVACLLFGLSPALNATGASPGAMLGARSATEMRGTLRFRRGLVVLQVALSMVLVVGALLFARSLRNLSSVELGFEPTLLAAHVDLRGAAMRPETRLQTLGEILERVRSVPGVRHAAEALIVPLSGTEWNGRIVVDGRLQDGTTYFNQVGGEYFRTMGTPLLRGRTFDVRDRADAPLTAVVNETFARRHFPDRDPVGQVFQMQAPPGRPQPVYEIVGLVRDAKYRDVREDFLPIVYLALAQEPQPLAFAAIVVRHDVSVASLTPALTRAVTEVAPGSAVSYDTLTQYVGELMVAERLIASLSALFGLLAMAIATVGLYGVVSYIVTRRKVEIAIRMALGAAPGTVLHMMLAESGVLLGCGVAAGVVIAAVLVRYAAALLYGLTPLDPTSFAVAALTLGSVGLVAAWIPARRAAAIPPMVALREEN